MVGRREGGKIGCWEKESDIERGWERGRGKRRAGGRESLEEDGVGREHSFTKKNIWLQG